jgi:hypothetical protein
MSECGCKRPKPYADMKNGGYRCQTCREKITPVPDSKNPIPYIVGVTGAPSYQPPRWAYLCPKCDREELYFKEMKNPTGQSQCESCREYSSGREVQEMYQMMERDYQEKKKNTMDRTLSLCGDGTYRGSNER